MDPSGNAFSAVAWKEMARLRYDAVALGGSELRKWHLVEELLAESLLPVVTTNAEVSRDGQWEPLAAPYLILERGGMRVGVLGLIAPSALPASTWNDEGDSLRILPLANSARQACRAIEHKVDAIVALVDCHIQEVDSLLSDETLAGLDLLLMASNVCCVRAERACRAGWRGTSLGLARLAASPGRGRPDIDCHAIDLTPDLPEDPLIAREAAMIVADVQKARDERERSRQQGLEKMNRIRDARRQPR